MNGVAHPVGDHGVQDLMPCGSIIPCQQIAGVDHSTCRELDADSLADHLQLIHEVEDALPGGVILDHQVDAVAAVLAAGNQDVLGEGVRM